MRTVGSFTFSGVENLTGGTAADTFKFTTGSVSGKIDGAGGTDTLDYSGDGGVAATVNLATIAATRTGGFVNIQKLVGSSSAADKLIGPNAPPSGRSPAPHRGQRSLLSSLSPRQERLRQDRRCRAPTTGWITRATRPASRST